MSHAPLSKKRIGKNVEFISIQSFANHKRPFAIVSLLAAICFYSTQVFANPTGGEVIAGQATITHEAQQTTINQFTQNVAINWQTFNIDGNELTIFNQPSSSAIALNRVVTNNPSQIFGKLQANGQVWLINPSGILFGRNAVVDVAGLVATTADLNTHDFMNGNYNFTQFNTSAHAVVNQGTITAKDAGLVALVAPGVQNDGIIQANYGRVALASGNAFTLDLHGDQLINLAVTNPVTQRAVDTEGNTLADAVTNNGTITAHGGKVLLTANVAKDVVENVINTRGIIEANTIANRNGEIIIGGGSSGIVKVSGKLSAAGKNTGSKGGRVQITGEKIGLFAGAYIDVSGDAGGGTALIGGNALGVGPLPNSKAVYVDKDAIINADAITQGDGGNIVVWSDDSTRFYGSASAKGGSQSGNGGLIETSGKWLDVTGAFIDASALAGVGGTWLLDPFSVTIDVAASNDGAFAGGNPDVWTPTATTSTILNTDISDRLNAGTSVTITTNDGCVGVCPTPDGNITLVAGAPITKTAGGTATLILDAANSITLNDAITSTFGILNLTLIASNSTQPNWSGNIGSIAINSSIDIPGGALTITNNGAAENAALSSRNAGNITINIPSGDAFNYGSATISAIGGDAVTIDGAAGGSGGTVSITVPNSVTALNNLSINTSGGNSGDGASAAQDGGTGGAGGNITINSGSSITFNSPNWVSTGGNGGAGSSTASVGAGGNGGNSGNISVTGGSISIVSPTVLLTGGNGGAGGSIGATAAGGGIGGNAGNFSITSTVGTSIINAALNFFKLQGGTGGIGNAGGAGGNGGAINLTGVLISLVNSTLLSQAGLGGDGINTAALGDGGTGGSGNNINFTATGSISLNNSTLKSMGNSGGSSAGALGGQGGNGGNITLSGNTGISLLNGSTLSAIGGNAIQDNTNAGTGGNITLSSNSSLGININNSSLYTTGGFSGGLGSVAGNSGKITMSDTNNGPITLFAATLSTAGGDGSSSTGTGGNGGEINITSTNQPITINSSQLNVKGGDADGAGQNGGDSSFIKITSTNSSITSNTSTYNISGGTSTGGAEGLWDQVFFQAPTVTLTDLTITSTGSGGVSGHTPGWIVFGDTINLTNPDLSNAFNFSNNAVTNHPDNFNITYTSAITDAELPTLSKFFGGSILGMNYSIASTTGDITLTDPTLVDGTGLTLNSSTGNITLNSDLGSTASLVSANFTAANTLNAKSILSQGSQIFSAATFNADGNYTITNAGSNTSNHFQLSGGILNLLNSPTVTTNGGSITVTDKVESAATMGLTLNPNGGNVTFSNLIGDISPLSTLTINNAGNVSFSSPVVLTGNLTSSQSSQFTTNSGASITTPGNILLSGGNIFLGGTIQAMDLTIAAAGSVNIFAPITLTGDFNSTQSTSFTLFSGANLTANSNDISINGGSIALLSSLDSSGVDGPPGTSGAAPTAGTTGGNGGNITLNGTQITFSNANIDAAGGNGGTGGSSTVALAGGNGGNGGIGGNITITTPSSIALSNSTVTTAGGNGGAGGNSVAAAGGNGGIGGTGGNINITHGNIFSLINSSLLATGGIGGNAGVGTGFYSSFGGAGAAGGNITLTGMGASANFFGNNSLISVNGGNAGNSTGFGNGNTGGNSGTITLNEPFVINAVNTSFNSQGGSGGTGNTGGNGGNGNSMIFTTQNLILSDSSALTSGGAAGTGSITNGTAGTTASWAVHADALTIKATGTNIIDLARLDTITNKAINGNPTSLHFEQDVNLNGNQLPAITDYITPNLTGTTYTVKSNLGSVYIPDPSIFMGSNLSIYAGTDITFPVPIPLSTALTGLLLNAGNDINIQSLATSGITQFLTAGNDINIANNSTVASSGGNIEFSRGNNITLGQGVAVNSSGGNISFNNGNLIVLTGNAALTSSGGNIFLSGGYSGPYQLTLDATSTGNITFAQNVPAPATLPDLIIQNAFNVSNINQMLFAKTFTQILGSGTSNFGAGGLNTQLDIYVKANFIRGKIIGQDTLLNGVSGNTANVNVHSLLLNGQHGGALTGYVGGFGGSDAAVRTQLASDAEGLFTMNGCPVGIGCHGLQAIFAENFDQIFYFDPSSIEPEKQCSFDQHGGKTDKTSKSGKSKCVPITVDKALE